MLTEILVNPIMSPVTERRWVDLVYMDGSQRGCVGGVVGVCVAVVSQPPSQP